MDAAIRDAVLVAFGLKEPAPTNDNALLASMQATISDAPAQASAPAAPAQPAASPAQAPLFPTEPPTDRRAAGLDVLRTILGTDPEAGRQRMLGQYPELANDVIDFALGEVWSHPALDRKTRSLMVLSMIAAIGGRPGALRSHINGALNHGCTPEEIVQALRMVAVYAGFPSALAAWEVMESVFADRKITRPGTS
jgi:4-carboxymuconolactone decarboxylase